MQVGWLVIQYNLLQDQAEPENMSITKIDLSAVAMMTVMTGTMLRHEQIMEDSGRSILVSVGKRLRGPYFNLKPRDLNTCFIFPPICVVIILHAPLKQSH